MESRNLPALRSLPLLPEKAILLYFCLIVYHLTSDSLKFPQISNPPFGTAYHLFPISGWHNKVSSNLKPQTSNLKSQISNLPIETFRPPSPLYRQRAGKAWRTFFHSPEAHIPWKRGRKSRSHHVTSVSPVHRK